MYSFTHVTEAGRLHLHDETSMCGCSCFHSSFNSVSKATSRQAEDVFILKTVETLTIQL